MTNFSTMKFGTFYNCRRITETQASLQSRNCLVRYKSTESVKNQNESLHHLQTISMLALLADTAP